MEQRNVIEKKLQESESLLVHHHLKTRNKLKNHIAQ